MVEPQPPAEPRASSRSPSQTEKAELHQILNSDRFQDQAPREVYATLIDEDQYLYTPMQQVLSWEPQFSLEESLARSYVWIEDQVRLKMDVCER